MVILDNSWLIESQGILILNALLNHKGTNGDASGLMRTGLNNGELLSMNAVINELQMCLIN